MRLLPSRFHVVERGLEAQGVPFGEASLDQMNVLWDQAKAEEKRRVAQKLAGK